MLLGVFSIGDFFPGLNWVDPRGLNTKLSKVRQSLYRFIDRIIDDHLTKEKKTNEADNTDLVDDLLAFYSEEAKNTKSVNLIRENIKAVIMERAGRNKLRGLHDQFWMLWVMNIQCVAKPCGYRSLLIKPVIPQGYAGLAPRPRRSAWIRCVIYVHCWLMFFIVCWFGVWEGGNQFHKLIIGVQWYGLSASQADDNMFMSFGQI
ncbi:hypothetical protein IFM89_005445 [Coptis chinensis]|uniref:Cytochrome P450 n=1 Tax=Coptis chinensis TaxID=261450 RepID=A0A835M938_9MAGN|nr:hypothetical protein IFM89_005445 [Coptis chinensis]